MSKGDAPILKVSHLTKLFGGLKAVGDVSLSVRPGERHGILGANGAGKTTLFNLICGVYTATSGEVELVGRDITKEPIHRRVRLGLGRTFQITNLFQELSVLENVMLATTMAGGEYRSYLRRTDSLSRARIAAEVVLAELGLDRFAGLQVSEIGYGQQRQLEVALALALQPKVLLLDEFTAGLSQVETTAMVELVKRLPDDLAVIIIEHDLDVIFNLVETMTMMNRGQVICEGTCQEVRDNPMVAEVYIGQSHVKQ